MSSTGYETAGRESSLKPLLEHPSPGKEIDWGNIGIFATGMAVGTALGATAALLIAQAKGEGFGGRIAGRPDRIPEGDAIWDELAVELARAAAELNRSGGE